MCSQHSHSAHAETCSLDLTHTHTHTPSWMEPFSSVGMQLSTSFSALHSETARSETLIVALHNLKDEWPF